MFFMRDSSIKIDFGRGWRGAARPAWECRSGPEHAQIRKKSSFPVRYGTKSCHSCDTTQIDACASTRFTHHHACRWITGWDPVGIYLVARSSRPPESIHSLLHAVIPPPTALFGNRGYNYFSPSLVYLDEVVLIIVIRQSFVNPCFIFFGRRGRAEGSKGKSGVKLPAALDGGGDKPYNIGHNVKNRKRLIFMNQVIIPEGYAPRLGLYDTQKAIGLLKRLFEDTLSGALRLRRVSAPLFVEGCSGLNDDLNGVERAVSFDVPATGRDAQVVHSLAKWKRLALHRYGFHPGKGLYTDMNAIRRDEALDNLHSVYVDQWDWEKVIAPEDPEHGVSP